MTRNTRIGFLLAAVVVVVVAIVLVGTGGSDDKKTTSGVTHLEVKNGQPVGGVKTIEVNKGDQVRFDVSSDKKVEIHSHMNDQAKDAAPGAPASYDFPADKDGIFEIEVEDTGTLIAKLRVDP